MLLVRLVSLFSRLLGLGLLTLT